MVNNNDDRSLVTIITGEKKISKSYILTTETLRMLNLDI